jgi:hypothetical protein
MKLTEAERERISDGVLKIQSVRASLDHVGKSKIGNREEIEECLEDVDDRLREALGYRQPSSKGAKTQRKNAEP